MNVIMGPAIVTARIRLDQFERFHAQRRVLVLPRATCSEVAITFLVALIVAPFFFATFFIIPMMGQISVGLAGLLTAIYLYFRKSVVIALTVMTAAVILSSLAFATIQSIKYNLEVPLFILVALGIPVTAMYCIFIAGRIWIVKGGVE